MRHIRILGPCVVAMLMMSVASAGASAALPELGRCVKVAKGTGEYTKGTCIGGVVANGTFDWMPGAVKNKFVSASGAATLETKAGSKIACKSILEEGTYLAPKEEFVTVRLFGCQITALGGACRNAGPEEIVTSVLAGDLGFVKAPSVGVDLGPVEGSPPLVEFECDTPAGGLVHVALLGSVIANVTAIDKMSNTFKRTYKASKGVQMPTKLEGEPADTLTLVLIPKPPEAAGLAATLTTSNEEPLEIKAKI